MQDSCIGTNMAVWFAAFLPFIYIWHFSPCYLSPTPHLQLSLPYFPQQTPVCSAPLPESTCSHCSTPAYEWEHVVFGFLFLCQFAENDGFQIHLSPNKGNELIIFYGCVVFHGVYVPHFLCPVYHWWAFGCWFQVFAIVNRAAMNIACVFIVEWFIVLLMGLLGQMEFLFRDPWEIAMLSSTMVELIYPPANCVIIVFLFLHILSSICCLQIF